MQKKLSVAFLWHMHQPLYKDLATGKYHLPWVRLHSTYSYLDMVSILDRFPRAKMTFNFTPSLILQLLDISKEGPLDDIYLQLSEKKATHLTDRDKYFLLKNFFSCDPKRAMTPFKKYRDLFSKRGNDLREEELIRKAGDFSVSDFRDLQVFFNLAWCGFTLRGKDPVVRELVRKGSNYTEDDKTSLLKRQREVVASIIPAYRRLQDEGRAEISTSPFYHPILPLLSRGRPGDGSDLSKDARDQVRKAIALYGEVFGARPAGMWPPEGGVDRETVSLLAGEGIKWAAADESILLESLGGKNIPEKELVNRVYTVKEDGRELDMVFRDTYISNAISFMYAYMPPRKAAADFLRSVRKAARTAEPREEGNIVTVILDGENPWPYYADGGKRFLSDVYAQLSSSRETELVTISGYLGSHKGRGRISELASGSWIDRDFGRWTGSPQKDRAWGYLKDARKELFSSGHPDADALEELYAAEGSDWFWWYDDFGSELNFVFDELFRLHLSNTYTLTGRKAPHYLARPVPAGPSIRKLPGAGAPVIPAARPRKVLIVSSEAVPFAKTGGLADVAGSLSQELVSLGCDARVIMPLYKCVTEGNFKITREKAGIRHRALGIKRPFDLYSGRTGKVAAYFVKNQRYFARDGLYGTPEGGYRDNGLRFGFFSKAVLSAIKAIDFKPDIIHCNDWQSALVPFYLRFKLADDEFYRGIKTLFTIHNLAYQGVFSKRIMRGIGIPGSFFDIDGLEFYGKLNFMKSGILYSDAVSTVSHRYAEEIMMPEYGSGLDGFLRTRKEGIYGIPNGADYSVWSPERDSFLKVNYGAGDVEKKIECKKDLLEYTRLPLPVETPLLGCISRLADQKGMDLLAGIMDRIIGLNAGVVILGSGSRYYNELFAGLAGKYPRNIYVCSDFNDELAHKIEAGCDMFVMPSRYEPCGLNQMYSIKYGTIPIVRATGGLDDVIVDLDDDNENGNGFKFKPATKDALYRTIERAVRLYREDKTLWQKLMVRAMGYDFSWAHSARQYLELYGKLIS